MSGLKQVTIDADNLTIQFRYEKSGIQHMLTYDTIGCLLETVKRELFVKIHEKEKRKEKREEQAKKRKEGENNGRII